jgi:transposase
MAHMTLMIGPERRRRWTQEQKLALVEAAFSAGSSVAAVGREAEVCTGQLYRWRRELGWGEAAPTFVPAVMMADQGAAPGLAAGAAAITVEVGGARVRIAPDASPALVAATLRALR